MHISSTILTVGTALRRAQDGGVQVHALVGGVWMTGDVLGVDGEGAVLQTNEGDTIVLRIQAVTAVRVEQAIATEDLREEPAPAAPAPSWRESAAAARSTSDDDNLVQDRIRVATEIFTRDLVELQREPQPA